MVSGQSSLNGGESSDLDPVSYTSIFYEHLPYYIQMGMSPEQFWEGDYTLVIAYREAWKLRLHKENRDMWLQGMYIYEALCDVSPVLHAFAKRGTKPQEYLHEPIAITQAEIDERREHEKRNRYENMRMQVATWAAQHNIKIAEETAKEVRE